MYLLNFSSYVISQTYGRHVKALNLDRVLGLNVARIWWIFIVLSCLVLGLIEKLINFKVLLGADLAAEIETCVCSTST